MTKRVLLIQGHPDTGHRHLGHALADAYAEGAIGAGHELKRIDVASLDFPLLRSAEDWEHGALPPTLADAQAAIGWCEHMVLFFPLWLGDMPAMLKGFLEQVARPGFAFRPDAKNPFGAKGLTGRSARVVVTMGMPALVYRWIYRAHSVRSLERNVLGFVGIAPVHETMIGSTGNLQPEDAKKWRVAMRKLGVGAQ